MTTIFISYRRDDAAGYAGWLSGLLRQRFGNHNVFIDLESIEAGEDFVANIERAVGSCDVLIALIGRGWLACAKPDGTRRLDDPRDFVRLEIGTALARNVRVIPALVGSARMPAEDELPDPLRPLARRNAIELSDARFAYDVERLVGVIERVLAGEEASPVPHSPAAGEPPRQPEQSAPGGVRACLIADLRGYTSFTVEQGDEAAARLAGRFATIAEEVAGRFDGRVIELRGDEALAVFDSPRNALRAAVALRIAAEEAAKSDPSLPLQVGIGLDAGEIVPMRGGYRGAALNRAARLCSLASAGEVFATAGMVHLAGRTEGVQFVDRGAAALKGLTEPVQVVQIVAEGETPDRLTPLTPEEGAAHPKLPDEVTPFIGREREILAAVELLKDASIRLLTLTGPGGTGKTRLALRAARAASDNFPDGVVFVPLTALSDASLVLPGIAEALEVREEHGRPLSESVIRALREKHLLLLLDSMEHLLPAAPALGLLLDACHGLHLLVTSRIPLRLAREHELPVPPLAVPPPGVASAETIERYESVALFVERARAVKPEFGLSAANAPVIAEICARLDGLPLALELAAARIRLFPPPALLQRLSNRLALLTGGARDRPTRQQTLRGTIDWSYSLLSPEEQRLSARLSVFSGGCTYEAAEAVCFEGLALDPLDGMSSLVEKSMVRQAGEEPRFSMLDTIREYAAEKLAQTPDAAGSRLLHARYFLTVAESAEPQLIGADLQDTLHRLEAEHDNFRGALAWALDAEPETALRLAVSLRRFWELRGYLAEGRRWLNAALAHAPSAPAPVRAWALLGAGTLARCQADYPEAEKSLGECLHLFEQTGGRAGCAAARGQLGLVAEQQGDLDRAQTLHEESLNLRRELADTWGIATSLHNLGLVAYHRGELSQARALLVESLALSRSLGDQRSVRIALNSLGAVLEEEGQYGEAERFYRESLEIGRRLGDRHGSAYALLNLGLVALQRNDPAATMQWLADGLRLLLDLGDRFATIMAMSVLAQAAVQNGQPERGTGLLAATQSLMDESGIRADDGERRRRELCLAETRAALGQAAFDAAWQAGMRLSLEEAAGLGLDLAAALPAKRRAPSPTG